MYIIVQVSYGISFGTDVAYAARTLQKKTFLHGARFHLKDTCSYFINEFWVYKEHVFELIHGIVECVNSVLLLQRNLCHPMTKPGNDMCAQRRLRSACAAAQSDQSSRCPRKETLGPQLSIERTAKTHHTGRMARLV